MGKLKIYYFQKRLEKASEIVYNSNERLWAFAQKESEAKPCKIQTKEKDHAPTE